MRIDLHSHSIASDGQYTPSELVLLADQLKLEVFSITDHDTVDGLEEASIAARQRNIFFVSGIEISAQEDEEIHILGYNIDYKKDIINEACYKYKKERVMRSERICCFLQKKGIDITQEDIKTIAGDSNIGRPHFATFLQQNNYVNNKREAFDKYLDTPEFYEATKRKHPSVLESIELIHEAGGVAVLAHPAFIHKDSEGLESMIAELKNQGLDGIECFYSRHSERQVYEYLEYAEKYNLKVSCGSDFHGELIKPDINLGMEFDYIKYGKKLIVKV